MFHFGNKGCSWEVSSCLPRREEKHSIVIFYGTEGTLHIIDPGYKVYNLKGEETGSGSGAGGEQEHIQNFLNAIRTGEPLNSEIEEGQKSTRLCHLGNISYKLGRTLKIDPQTHKITGDPAAEALWGREYRPGWEPVV
jgi:hypothetical protein